MNLHTPGEKPDWELSNRDTWNSWQWMAAYSHGILTPSNIISVAGLALVLAGLAQIAIDNYAAAALLIGLGRLFDLLDGLVAEWTSTKSPLGEMVDSVVDKIEIYIALIVAALSGSLPFSVIFGLSAVSIWISLASFLAHHRRIPLHPSLPGKLAGAASWVSVVLFILENALIKSNNLILWTAYIFFVIFVVLGSRAAFVYSLTALRRLPTHVQMMDKFDNFVALHNPESSNSSRSKQLIKELRSILPKKPEVLRGGPGEQHLSKQLQKYLKSVSGRTLILIGGGDGTVHQTVNTLLEFKDKNVIKNSALLPLWSGNANDFAFMLNGLPLRKKLKDIFARGQVVEFRPLEITIKRGDEIQTKYATCYASFGATALAAHKLNSLTRSRSGPLSGMPIVILTKEILSVVSAFKNSPVFKAEVDGKPVKIFEETFTKGSRFAKINAVPIKLTDETYYHAHQVNKHPFMSKRVVQIMTGRKFGEIIARPTSFTLHEPTLAQFDGEVTKISEGSKITVSLSRRSLKAISIKL